MRKLISARRIKEIFSANGILTLACRLVLWIAERLVPESMREAWRGEWRGDMWRWILESASVRVEDSRFALLGHTKLAFREAVQARFHSESGREGSWSLIGNPAFCLGMCAVPLVAVAILSAGLPATRQLAHGQPYRQPDRVVVLAQGPPILGLRLGFRDQDAEVFRKRSETIEGIASYVWRQSTFQSGNRSQEVMLANVSSDFFRVLGVGPASRNGPDQRLPTMEPFPPPFPAIDEFWASQEFWRKEMHGDRQALGRTFKIGGHELRLAGVMPGGFTFLSAPVSIWTSSPEATPPPGSRWWMSLKGTVGRLRPGVEPAAAERELRQLLVKAGIARRGYQVKATLAGDLVFWALRMYGWGTLGCVASLLLWSAFNAWRDRRRGVAGRVTRRFWGFFALKVVLPLLALFLLTLEWTGSITLSTSGGIRGGGGLFSAWVFFCGVVLLWIWAVRDQRARCRVCLHRMRQPIRIGIPGQMLLETTGLEVMCPHGHGSVYTSASVMGSDISNRWLAFEEILPIETGGDEHATPGTRTPAN